MAVFLPILFFAVPSVVIGLFDARGKWSLAFIVRRALGLAWFIMATSRLVLVYSPDRFLELTPLVVRKVSGRWRRSKGQRKHDIGTVGRGPSEQIVKISGAVVDVEKNID